MLLLYIFYENDASYAMMNYLSNFVKRGDPNKPKSPNENTYGLTVKNFYLNLEWERYTLDNKKRLVFSLDGKQGPNFKSPSQVNYRLGLAVRSTVQSSNTPNRVRWTLIMVKGHRETVKKSKVYGVMEWTYSKNFDKAKNKGT